MNNCIFCKLSKQNKKQNFLYDDEKVFVISDLDWAVKGHTLVLWKKHVKNASDLSLDDYLHFSRVFYKTEKALLNFLKVDKSIVLKSGSFISHFHFHIYPVRADISWQEVKDMFDKKTRFQISESEKEKFINRLKLVLQ